MHAAAVKPWAIGYLVHGHTTAINTTKVRATSWRRSIVVRVSRCSTSMPRMMLEAWVIRVLISDMPDDLRGLRDRALLLLGFAGALRRSELVALDASDIEEGADGIFVRIGRSKTDQEGAGDFVSIPYGSRLRPVRALKDWIEASGISDGPLFRRIRKGGRVIEAERLSDRSVANILKLHARSVGLDDVAFSGHSLRAGFVTSALQAGADVLRVMDITRHRQINTLKVYDRRAKAFKQHAGEAFL